MATSSSNTNWSAQGPAGQYFGSADLEPPPNAVMPVAPDSTTLYQAPGAEPSRLPYHQTFPALLNVQPGATVAPLTGYPGAFREVPPSPHVDAANQAIGPNLGGADAVVLPTDPPASSAPSAQASSGISGTALLIGGGLLLLLLLGRK